MAQDNVLVPENFYLHKGGTLVLHQISANQFLKQDELGFDPSKLEKFILRFGSGKNAYNVSPRSGDTVERMPLAKEGLNLIAITRKPVIDDVDRDDFLKILEDEGLTQFAEKAKNGSKDSFRERYTWSLKTLVEVDKHSANDFDKSIDQEYEITLKDNPYKGNYGDDIIALVTFRGTPIAGAGVFLYIKSLGGNVVVQKLATDKTGQIYFKLSREGIYMLRSLHMETSKDKSADFDTWLSSFTFAFNSNNDMPNTYKEFGFGNKH